MQVPSRPKLTGFPLPVAIYVVNYPHLRFNLSKRQDLPNAFAKEWVFDCKECDYQALT